MKAITAAVFAAAAAAAFVSPAHAPASRLTRLLGPPASRGPRRRPGPPPIAAAVVLDLVAAVLAAGAPVATSVRAVGHAMAEADPAGSAALLALAQRHELALGEPPPGVRPPWIALLDETLLLARHTGLAPGALLASAAADDRRRVAAARRAAAARLGVRVVLPTGICLLPAFIVLTVAPVVLALLGVAS
jgi:tight adherence protein B